MLALVLILALALHETHPGCRTSAEFLDPEIAVTHGVPLIVPAGVVGKLTCAY